MALASEDDEGRHFDLDPPLRANERVMSGLFATAISRVALRSRTEVRIDKAERDSNVEAIENESEGDGIPATTNGRVDYLAWYGSRVIGIELKMAGMNCETPKLTGSVKNRWSRAVDQARTVQTCLRERQKEDSNRYPSPISLALMVIVGRRAIAIEDFKDVNCKLFDMEKETVATLKGLKPRPAFMATYTFPQEFRTLVPRRKGKEAPKEGRAIYTPFVSFIAKAAVNTTGG